MRPFALFALVALSLSALSGTAFSESGLGASPRGGGGQDEPAGAYASPSAIPEDPASRDIGIPFGGRLKRFAPIKLPDGSGPLGPQGIDLPTLPAFAPQPLPSIPELRQERSLVLQARLEKDGPAIPSGLVWRLFSPIPAIDGKLPVVAVSQGGEAVFSVSAGSYILHVGFGRAGITKRIHFSGRPTRETVVLNAGGLRLHGLAADNVAIPADRLNFDIYSEATAAEDRRLVAENIGPDTVVRLNAGTYHVVSNYGSVNAVVRADMEVEAGRITDATLRHHAAELTMKLVREHGGEAIADTAWSISSASGDLVREDVGAFSSMVLAEGDYVIVAKNRDRLYRRDLSVHAGLNAEVEVLTSDLQEPSATPADPNAGSGD